MCPNLPDLSFCHTLWSRAGEGINRLKSSDGNRNIYWLKILVISAIVLQLFQVSSSSAQIEVISEETEESSSSSYKSQESQTIVLESETTVVEDGHEHRIQVETDWDDSGIRTRHNYNSDIEGDDIIAFGRDIYVDEDEYIDGNVICILGSAYINGTVDGEVVAIGGNVNLHPGAIVYGQAVSVGGGNVVVPDRAVIHGEAVTIGGRIQDEIGAVIGDRMEITFLPSFSADYGLAGFGWIIFFAHLLCVGFTCLIIMKIQKERWGVAVMTLRDRGWESLLAGVGGGIIYSIILMPLMLVLAFALVAIVVGIPLIPVIVLLLLLFPIPGYMIASILLGYTVIGLPIEQKSGEEDPSRQYIHFKCDSMSKAFWLGHVLVSIPSLAGLMLIAFGLPFQVPFVFWILGGTVINLVLTLGWGSFLLSRFGKRPPPYVTVT